MNKSSFNYNVVPLATFTPKEKEGNVDKDEAKVDWLFYAECKYKCKKGNSLEKHMLTKHTDHQCKQCQEKLPAFKHLLKHVGKDHYKDQSEPQETICEEHPKDDAILNNDYLKEEKSTKGFEVEKEYSVVFDKSMLKEFLSITND